MRHTMRTGLSPRVLRGVAVECAWMATHLAIYPLGLARDSIHPPRDPLSLGRLRPAHRGLLVGDVEAARTPILLVHGMVDNRSIFTMLRRGLRRRGFGRVVSMNYTPLLTDVRAGAELLAAQVEQLCAETEFERIHVVGHSLGGLVARYYVQRMGGDQRVHTLVTLGAPHGGTLTARLLPHGLTRQLRPGSELLTELAEPAPGCRTRFLSVWSDLDQMILPRSGARIDHPDLSARNVLIRGTGHMSLPVDGRVVHEICSTLGALDGHAANPTGRDGTAPGRVGV